MFAAVQLPLLLLSSSCSLLLRCLFEVSAYQFGGNIIFILFLFAGCFFDWANVAQYCLQEVILLGPDLLQDLWHQVLQLFGLWVSSDNHKVLTNRELNYKKRKVVIRISAGAAMVEEVMNVNNSKLNGHALSTYFMASWNGWQCYHPWTYSLRRCLAEVARLH